MCLYRCLVDVEQLFFGTEFYTCSYQLRYKEFFVVCTRNCKIWERQGYANMFILKWILI